MVFYQKYRFITNEQTETIIELVMGKENPVFRVSGLCIEVGYLLIKHTHRLS